MEFPERAKILIVDDESSKLLALRSVLEELGQELVTATSGRDALRILLNEDFAVILLDVNMPDIDGFETASLIRQRKRSEHVPIIFVTSYYDDARALQSYSLGAVDYLMTPFVPEILRAKIRVFVDLFRMQQQVRQQADERVALAQEQSARAAAEKANKSKSEFLANVSHELRTPMNAIIGMTQLALDESISAEARDYLRTAQTSAYVLLGLLNEILDLSRMEAGKFVLEIVTFNVQELVEETIKALSVRAYEKGIECSFLLDEDVPRWIHGDPLRLRQILMNLLGNAIKFTHIGEVWLHVAVESRSGEDCSLLFEVFDTGIGIANAEQERIFAPFTQADSSMTRRYGGTGLGLAIASDLVNLMNGRIWVESAPGSGTIFRFTLACVADDTSPQPERPTHSLPGQTVLVLDPSPRQGAVLVELLRRQGHLPRLFTTGEGLLEHLRIAGTIQPAPVAIINWPHPANDVQPVIHSIAEHHPQARLLILVSANDRQTMSDWNSSQQVQYLEKPAIADDLRAALQRLSSTASPCKAPVTRVEIPARVTHRLRILVAEDTPANQKLLSAVLTKRGHEVRIARDGREAVTLFVQQPFDVILMDVQMPEVDGLQATAEIRRCTPEDEPRVPILAMTAHAMEGDRERFLAAGMDDYFAKPIHLPKLVEYLETRFVPAAIPLHPAGVTAGGAERIDQSGRLPAGQPA